MVGPSQAGEHRLDLDVGLPAYRSLWRLHARLDQRQMYRACYGLLLITAMKLLWDGVSGYLR